jgi:Ni,Fe-hydrogenase I cytochrome b subunit
MGSTIILIHPVVALTVVLLSFTNAYLGISRYEVVKGSRNKLFRFNRRLHIKVGKIFIVLLFIAYPLGLIGFREAGAANFSTPHAYLGLLLLLIFGIGASFGFKILHGEQDYIPRHGLLMIIGTLLIFLQVLGGISNLRAVGLL